MRAPVLTGTLLLSALTALACSGGGSDDSGLSATEQQSADIEAYEVLQAQLDQTRSEFLTSGRDGSLVAESDTLYWLNYTNWDPTLHRWEEPTDRTIDYDLYISGDSYNYRVSDRMVVSVREEGGTVVYHAWDADSPDTLLGELEMPAPADEQKWYAYAADEEYVYILKTGEQTRLERWLPGEDETTLVTTLESAGVEVGILWEFGVGSGGTEMVVIESGRIWWVDLLTNDATWLQNETEVRTWVEMSEAGVLFDTYDGLMFWDHQTSGLRNLSEELATHEYQLSVTYAVAHEYNETAGFTLYGSTVIYVGHYGLFAYDMKAGWIEPLLLNPRDLPRIDYRRPRILDSGLLFVEGLTSESGAVGSSGPIYAVESDLLLK